MISRSEPMIFSSEQISSHPHEKQKKTSKKDSEELSSGSKYLIPFYFIYPEKQVVFYNVLIAPPHIFCHIITITTSIQNHLLLHFHMSLIKYKNNFTFSILLYI